MLSSGTSKKYRKPFVLDEDGLRRIQATIEKNAKDIKEDVHIVFHVEREDDRFYETTEIADVLSDPNVAKKKIILVAIELRRKDENSPPYKSNQIVLVYFSHFLYSGPKDSALFRISSQDKNWALLLADELEPQITRILRAKCIPRWLIGLLLSFLYIVFFQIIYPLANDMMTLFRAIAIISIGLACSYSVEYLPSSVKSKVLRLIGPESGFLWGEEGETYQEHEKMRQNIYWGVIIAFIISIGASFAYAWMTNGF